MLFLCPDVSNFHVFQFLLTCWIYNHLPRLNLKLSIKLFWLFRVDINSGKDPDAGNNWGQEEKRAAEDEMVGWYHQLNEHESEQTPGDSEQGSLVCCSPWGRKGSDTTEWLSNNPSLNAISLPPSLASYGRTWLRFSFIPIPDWLDTLPLLGKIETQEGILFQRC